MSKQDELKVKGRGAQAVLSNRFDKNSYHNDGDFYDVDINSEENGLKTKFLKVFPKSLVNPVPSKDIYLNWSMNPYQGCEHGCSYCYARTTHEFWGYNAGLDFERNIMYKPNAAELLRKFLNRKSWVPEGIMLSGNTDCYQPAEKQYGITRELLKTLNRYKNPVGIITKNSLIERDIDILSEMAQDNLVRVVMSITTLDEEIRRAMEPRTSSSKRKLQTIEKLVSAKIPVQVMMGPIIPGLTSHEIPEIIKTSAEAGADWATYTMVRLNGAVAEVFEDWLHKSFPNRASKVLNQIKEVNGGVLSNTIGGNRMTGGGTTGKIIRDQFRLHRAKHMVQPSMEFNTSLFAKPGKQLGLF